ncbi:MAG: terB [Xanthobacteraceae bacterium]|jgi:tellurite resistance protein|nr:terB [Xanthobacteraceae bacterium]
MFGVLKRVAGAAAKEVQADYSGNRDYLEAVCAACALVAYADGQIEDAERAKVVRVLTGHASLGKMYDQRTIEQTAETMFKRAGDRSGRQALANELDDIRSRPNAGQMADDIYLIADDVAHADGELEPAEVEVLKKIAGRLGVDTSKFEF